METHVTALEGVKCWTRHGNDNVPEVLIPHEIGCTSGSITGSAHQIQPLPDNRKKEEKLQ
jgi:hypothetical protein